MLLFIGDQTNGYWIEEPARVNGQSVEYVDANINIKNQTNDILRIRPEKVNYIVYDLEQYGINATEIADEIYSIAQAGNAEPIFIATSFLPTSELVQQLQRRGFNKFIFPYDESLRKDELEKCINGYYNQKSPEQLLDIKKEDISLSAKNKVSIGIAGACTRIGTTTHAIQIVKHLLYCGKKACYIEINGTGFVRDLLEAYMPESVNEEKGLVSFENVDLYYRQDLIPEILHMDYEYYVYDYGTFSDQDFNKISFMEKNIKVMVLGSKPNEIQKSTQLITSVFYQDIYYLFNFTAKADQDDLREMMEQKGERTFFTEYCPDMFYYEPKEYCKAIFPEVIPEKKDIKPKKRKWWNSK